MTNPILYSFRRCPYAMRARLAITISGIQVELREVVLRNKPAALLQASPKGTVPVLITAENHIIEESLDIMHWALKQSDPDNWLLDSKHEAYRTSQSLITNNDGDFKYWLDRYKYADRFPEHSEQYYRQQAEKTLVLLEQQLQLNGCLISARLTLADMAILPFIRQFAAVNSDWFQSAPYPLVRNWLTDFCHSALFQAVMLKYPAWQSSDPITLFPST